MLTAFFISLFLIAQETTKQKEVGLVFNNLDNFGLTYKTGSDNSLWRFNTLFISGSNLDETADSLVMQFSNMGFRVSFGREYRKEIAEKLELRFGADISFRYTQSKSEYNYKSVNNYDRLYERITYQPGINLVLGLNYVFNGSFVIGAEVLPSFSYTTGTSVQKNYYSSTGSNEIKSDISGFNYGLSTSSVLLSLAYRF